MSRLNDKQVRRAFAKAASGFNAADFFHSEVRERLMERLDWVKLDPQVVLELGAGTLAAATDLRGRFPQALLLGLDFSESMLRVSNQSQMLPLCAMAEAIPLGDQSTELVLSNLLLHWSQDPKCIIEECSRVLKISGLFSFTVLGPASFIELRTAWAAVDDYQHVHDFEDMHNIGDALIKAGLQEPVMDAEVITVTYAEPRKLVQDLRGIGATNRALGARPGLTTRQSWQAMEAALEKFRDTDGRLPVTLEVIYGHAWKLQESLGSTAEDGIVHFPLDRLIRGTKA